VDATETGTTATLDADVLWRLCVRMVEPEAVRFAVHGDRALADAALQIVSIIR